MTRRIAVIGDVHANALALQAALEMTERMGYDKRILLGDLLTYGVEVRKTVDLVAHAQADGRTVVLRGNHDQMYEEMLVGSCDYVQRLPDWIRASVDWTLARLDAASWQAITFQDEWADGARLFAHANPYGAGDWTYLNTVAEHHSAANCLVQRGFSLGVFGHTHRARWFNWAEQTLATATTAGGCLRPRLDGADILNAGSIGQPREASPQAYVLWLVEEPEQAAEFHFEPLSYDVSAHCQGLRQAGFAASVEVRLMSYYQPDGRRLP